MKKILVILMVMLMISGCSNNSEKQAVFVKNDEKYALCVNGELETDYIYTNYEAVGNDGFVVHNGKKDSYIDRQGKEKIAYKKGTTLTVLENLIIAEDEDQNYTIYNSTGEQLYKSGKKTEISIYGLPVIKEDKEYTVLSGDGETVVNGKSQVYFTSVYKSTYATVCYKDSLKIFDLSVNPKIDEKGLKLSLAGEYQILAVSDDGYVLYDQTKKNMVFADDEGEIQLKADKDIDSAIIENDTIIAKKDDNIYIMSFDGSVDVKATSYYKNSKKYLIKNEQYVYGPHQFVNNGKTEEVTGIQLNPDVSEVIGNLFPVYVQSKGYQYYDFSGKAKIDTYFKYCGDFTKDKVAVVSKDGEKYYLIDEDGKKISEKYEKIESLGNGYYAGYETSTKFEVLNAQGQVVIEDYFMGESEIFTFDEEVYGLFNKSGTTHVYNMSDYSELFSLEGEYTVYQERYLVSSDYKKYYDMSGELFYKR